MMVNLRTPSEIVARIKLVKADAAFLDHQAGDLILWLPLEDARPFIRDDVTAEQFAKAQESGDPLDTVRSYLPFAWDKANGCRGLSAIRSVSHLKAWLWLAGFDLNAEFDARYSFYGKPCLVISSEIAGFDWRKHDDGCWTNVEGGSGLRPAERAREIERAVTASASVLERPTHA